MSREKGMGSHSKRAVRSWKIFWEHSVRASRFSWGFPSIDLWTYTDTGSGMLKIKQQTNSKETYVYPKNFMFPSRVVVLENVLVRFPSQIGRTIDIDYRGWRETCVVSSYDYRIERLRNITRGKVRSVACSTLAKFRPSWLFSLNTFARCKT